MSFLYFSEQLPPMFSILFCSHASLAIPLPNIFCKPSMNKDFNEYWKIFFNNIWILNKVASLNLISLIKFNYVNPFKAIITQKPFQLSSNHSKSIDWFHMMTTLALNGLLYSWDAKEKKVNPRCAENFQKLPRKEIWSSCISIKQLGYCNGCLSGKFLRAT